MKFKLFKNNWDSSGHWSTVIEAGTLFGLQFLRLVYSIFGRKAVSILLYPTVAYFLLFRPYSRQSSKEYLERHARYYKDQWKNPPGIWQIAVHFKEFAETVVDKLLSWFIHIDSDQFVLADKKSVDLLLEDSRGQLIIGSHFGNLEYCRGFMHRYRDKKINILVHDKHSQNYTRLMKKLNPESRLNIFQVSEFSVSTTLLIKRKIDAGEWVFIAGDRTPPGQGDRTVRVEFLGEQADFPVGPFLLAKGLACPVKLMFSYRNYFSKDSSVYFDVIHFAEKIELSRSSKFEDLKAYAQRFATQLEQKCGEAPYQWFNFYDFWKVSEGKREAVNEPV